MCLLDRDEENLLGSPMGELGALPGEEREESGDRFVPQIVFSLQRLSDREGHQLQLDQLVGQPVPKEGRHSQVVAVLGAENINNAFFVFCIVFFFLLTCCRLSCCNSTKCSNDEAPRRLPLTLGSWNIMRKC